MYSTTVKEEIKKDLKSILSAHRYKHVLGVAKAARQLALQNDCDPDKAEVAGLLHDAAKQLPLPDMQELARQSFGDSLDDAIMTNGGLLHGYAAVTIARTKYHLTDEDFLASLAHHTTGAEVMGTLEKIIFVADYIEENRDFDWRRTPPPAGCCQSGPGRTCRIRFNHFPSAGTGQAYFYRYRHQPQCPDSGDAEKGETEKWVRLKKKKRPGENGGGP
jgi:predicted HD superfamily hydrolase involved in NAD metabolism